MTKKEATHPTPINAEVAAEVASATPDATPQPRPQFFEAALGEAVQSLYTQLMAMKGRGRPGALRHGVTGAHIIVQEILDNAENQSAYLTIAVYSIAAALLGTGYWDLPTIQVEDIKPPEREQEDGINSEELAGASEASVVAESETDA